MLFVCRSRAAGIYAYAARKRCTFAIVFLELCENELYHFQWYEFQTATRVYSRARHGDCVVYSLQSLLTFLVSCGLLVKVRWTSFRLNFSPKNRSPTTALCKYTLAYEGGGAFLLPRTCFVSRNGPSIFVRPMRRVELPSPVRFSVPLNYCRAQIGTESPLAAVATYTSEIARSALLLESNVFM